jgi:hypothetical protein
MRRFIGGGLAVSLVLFPLFGYTYVKGGIDGVLRYQRSRRFALTLYSMYMFGVRDGYDKCKAEK